MVGYELGAVFQDISPVFDSSPGLASLQNAEGTQYNKNLIQQPQRRFRPTANQLTSSPAH